MGTSVYELPQSSGEEGYLYVTRMIAAEREMVNIISVHIGDGLIHRDCDFNRSIQSIAHSGEEETIGTWAEFFFFLFFLRIKMP